MGSECTRIVIRTFEFQNFPEGKGMPLSPLDWCGFIVSCQPPFSKYLLTPLPTKNKSYCSIYMLLLCSLHEKLIHDWLVILTLISTNGLEPRFSYMAPIYQNLIFTTRIWQRVQWVEFYVNRSTHKVNFALSYRFPTCTCQISG